MVNTLYSAHFVANGIIIHEAMEQEFLIVILKRNYTIH